MPFGLCNAPSTFQSLMDKLFSGEYRKYILPYLDDLIILSENLKQHYEHLENVFSKLQEAQIFL